MSEWIIRILFFIWGYIGGRILDYITDRIGRHIKITTNRKNIQQISNKEFKDIKVLYSGIP